MQKYLCFFLLIFTIITGFYLFLGWSQLPEGHRYIYPIDDVYIHLALAKNFAEHGVWSINTTGFDSASSSILYTLLLSFFIKIFGNWEYYPLSINITAGYLTVYFIYKYFRDFYGKKELIWALFFFLPFSLLYVMVLFSMEHTLHMFLIVIAVYYIQKNVINDFRGKSFVILLLILLFISIVRFESMFFTVSLVFALFLRKNFVQGIIVLVTGFLPIIIFGIVSENQGGYFFPNSVMIKGNFPEGEHFLYSCLQLLLNGIVLNFSFYKWLFFPLLIIFLYLIKRYKKTEISKLLKNETIIITFFCTAMLHSLFAILKYRYENYLMIGILLIIIPIISKFISEIKEKTFTFNMFNVLTLGSIGFIIFISIYRFGYHHNVLKFCSKGINEQQVEMSRFLHNFYRGEKVVANDIGAISYYSQVQLLDIVGLGSTEVTRTKVANKIFPRGEGNLKTKKFITNFVSENNFRVAVIYPEWFFGAPSHWIPVASWTINEKSYGPAIHRVVFYALKPEEVKPLQQNLMRFDLNNNVKQIFYIIK